MVDRSLSQQTQSSPPPGNGSKPSTPLVVTLTETQWNELEDCTMAFHAAIGCEAHQGGEEAELIKCVYVRLSKAMLEIRSTISFPPPEDE